jgi:DNA-binding PadR family transcriptional regulator
VKKLTSTSYAILGLLALRPWTAYELSQQMRRNVGEYWPRAERGIYDEPKALVAHGLATSTEQREGRRARTVYSITPRGRAALRSWLAEPSAPPQFESEAVLRIAFAEHGSPQDALDTLAALGEQARERRRYITDIAREYVEGRGPYPERLGVISVVMRFFTDYYDLLEDWSSWAAHHLGAEDDDDSARNSAALATLTEIAALRPAPVDDASQPR